MIFIILKSKRMIREFLIGYKGLKSKHHFSDFEVISLALCTFLMISLVFDYVQNPNRFKDRPSVEYQGIRGTMPNYKITKN